MTQALAITAVGMVTGVGLNAPAGCAAIRSGINNFQETRFMDQSGEWIMACSVPLEQPWRGKTKLIKMAAMSILECLAQVSSAIKTEETPLLLCLPEADRPGRVIEDDNAFFFELQEELNLQFHPKSRVIAQGRVSVGVALQHARALIHGNATKQVLIAATDSLLTAKTLAEFQERDYLLTSANSDGFIPGEASAALMLTTVYRKTEPQLICHGLGFGTEPASIDSEEPLRAEGLTNAIKAALKEAHCEMHAIDFRITDVSGKQYYFKEASLALSKTLRKVKEEFPMWHPADCIGETGAAIGLIALIICQIASIKQYALGQHILCHFSAYNSNRTAVVLAWQITGES